MRAARGFLVFSGLAVFLVLSAASLACSSSSTSGSLSSGSGLDGGQCTLPSNLTAVAPGVKPCTVGHAQVWCTQPSGGGCGCIADSAASGCPGCTPTGGTTCENKCAPNQYAVACGGLGSGQYEQVPDACVGVVYTPGGVAFACCPCE